MQKYLYNYQVVTSFSDMIKRHALMLRCQPAENAMQHIEEQHIIIPDIFKTHHGTDTYGNRIIYGGTSTPHSVLAYVSTGVVSLQEYRIPEKKPQPYYRMPSRQTQPSPEMTAMHIEGIDNNTLPPYDRAVLVCKAVHDTLTYSPNRTTVRTTAAEALNIKLGVCQDFAHLMIAVCRLHGITARYANGFIVGTGVTHAWVEVYDGQAWRGIDPTHNISDCEGYIKLAHGRDALDCSVDRGIFTGHAGQSTKVTVEVTQL